MAIIAILIIALVIYLAVRKKPTKVGEYTPGFNRYFSHLQFSSDEFYKIVERIIASQEMPGVKIFRVQYHDGGILSNKREYLRIERKEDIFDICAAPFGTGFFISYWLGEPKHPFRDLASRIPYLSTIAEASQGTTLFKADTAAMFKGCVKDSLLEAIEEITNTKGVRALSDAEKISFGK